MLRLFVLKNHRFGLHPVRFDVHLLVFAYSPTKLIFSLVFWSGDKGKPQAFDATRRFSEKLNVFQLGKGRCDRKA